MLSTRVRCQAQLLTVTEYVRGGGGPRPLQNFGCEPPRVDGALRALHAEPLHHLLAQIEVRHLSAAAAGACSGGLITRQSSHAVEHDTASVCEGLLDGTEA